MSGGVTAVAPACSARAAWMGFLGALLGCFMAMLDIEVTSASIREIQGAMSASIDEGAWITTAYIVAEMIVIPIAGFLAHAAGLRRCLTWMAIAFVGASLACAAAWDLTSLVAFRALQGLTGGALIPIAMIVLFTIVPVEQRAIGTMLYGLASILGTTVGPLVGGTLTAWWGWQSIFLINVVPGAVMLALVRALPDEAPRPGVLAGADWLALTALAVGMGAFTVVCEQGQRWGWLDSATIRLLAAMAAVALATFVWRGLAHPRPFVNLRLFRHRDFAVACLLNAVFGGAIYATVFLLPLFLAKVLGYNSLQIGEVVMWAGLSLLVVTPVALLAAAKLDRRLVLAGGLAAYAGGFFLFGGLTHQSGIEELWAYQMVRLAGVPFIALTLLEAADAAAPHGEEGSASSLFNVARNLGGVVGIAAITALLPRREDLHAARLAESLGERSAEALRALEGTTTQLAAAGVASPDLAAMAIWTGLIRREASVMAINDCFVVVGWCLLASVVLVPALSRGATSGPARPAPEAP